MFNFEDRTNELEIELVFMFSFISLNDLNNNFTTTQNNLKFKSNFYGR